MVDELADKAITTQEALRNRASSLVLSGAKLERVPPDLRLASSLKHLDLSSNAVSYLPEGCLPRNLVEIVLTGCLLHALPQQLKQLPNLQRLFLGANSLADITVVFECPSLQHAGISYNHVSSLPAAAVLQQSPLLSLDLSHNNMSSLRAATLSLAKLPQLSNLNLAGNPLCLMPDYQHSVRTSLTRLFLHDGERLDALSGSRPATVHPPQTSSGVYGHSTPATYMQLSLSGLSISTNPFQGLLDRWQQQIDEAQAANATVPPSLDVPALPLQPVYYHVDVQDPEGVHYSSLPLKVSPPAPPDVASLFDPKAKAAKVAADAKAAPDGKKPKPPSAKGGKGAGTKAGNGAGVLEGVDDAGLQTGCLRVVIPLHALPEHRDWLRNGFKVVLQQTVLTAVADPDAPACEAPATPPPKGKKKDEAPEVQFTVHTQQECIGSALVRVGAPLVEGAEQQVQGQALFAAPKALFDERGIRLAVKDEQHSLTPLGSMDVHISLHVQPQDFTQQIAGGV